jgi:hypothetical protein
VSGVEGRGGGVVPTCPDQLTLPGLEPALGQLTLPGLETDLDHNPDAVTPVFVWGPPPAETVTRFWAKVTRTPGCWWWGGAVSHPDGYGRITFTQDRTRRTLSAHRFALLLDQGQLRHETFVEHHCNETLCVRVHPDHIRPGTQSSNLRYAVALGRHRGSLPGNIDPRGRHARALAIRSALAHGYNPLTLAVARDPHPNPALFDLAALPAPRGVVGGGGYTPCVQVHP